MAGRKYNHHLFMLPSGGMGKKGEDGVMKLAILIVIAALGLMIPLLWITGTLTTAVYFIRQKMGVIRKEEAIVLDPQLGLTMADGGDAIDKKEKK
jgi:hypothetical protein